LTSEADKNGNPGSSRKVETREAVDPGDLEIIREDGGEENSSPAESAEKSAENDDPEWLRKIEASSGKGEKKQEKKASARTGGRKKPRKASKAEIADHLARKNEMLQKLRERLAETEKTLEVKEDRLMRLAAEFENYKKRTSREWDLLKNQANAGLLTEILGVLDDLDRAFDHAGDSLEHFRDGIALIHSSLLDLLKRNGLKEIDALGKPFDPQFHEAVAEMNSPDFEAGVVAEVVQKGYMMKDQVLRPARVVVSKGDG